MATADVQLEVDQEVQRIERWRLEALERGGYPSDAAVELAVRHDVDLHFAVSLIERGCSPDMALRILL